jgi:hypothetical protein
MLNATLRSNVALVSKLKLTNVVPERFADVGVFNRYAYLAAWDNSAFSAFRDAYRGKGSRAFFTLRASASFVMFRARGRRPRSRHREAGCSSAACLAECTTIHRSGAEREM